MIVLDTNVISELMRDRPARTVLTWLDDQFASTLFITAVTEAEIWTGIAVLPLGRRRRGIGAAADRAFEIFAGRILPFDSDAARAYATIAAERRASGRPITQADCQIAAITRCRGAQLATRNVKDFEGTGVTVINPWADTAT
jgi:predicted nucleic acid-binding protein